MSRAEVGAKDDTLFFAVKTIGMSKYGGRKPQTLLDAARHNRRVIAAELGPHSHINPARTHLNQNIAGPDAPAGVVTLAAELMTGAGVDVSKLRKDHTQAQELLFSLPANTTIDAGVFFGQCLDWTVRQFGRDAILSADIHLDEAAPHLHILLIPIADGRYLGSKLITRMELAKLRESFAELALTYGLREPTRRLHGARREQAAQKVLVHLEATRDPLLQSALWFTVKPDIVSNPARYAARLGIVLPETEAPVKKAKTMAQIFTGKGKGSKVERKQKPIGFESTAFDDVPKPIGFENSRAIDHENIETIALLVSPKSHPPSLPTKPPKTEAHNTVSSEHQVDSLDGSEAALPAIQTVQPDKADGLAKPAVTPRPAKRVTRASTNLKPDTPVSRAASLAWVHQHHGAETTAMPEEVHQEDHDVTRERDADNAAGHWCAERGEFIQAPKPPHQRAARQKNANAWVAGELQARGRMKSNSQLNAV